MSFFSVNSRLARLLRNGSSVLLAAPFAFVTLTGCQNGSVPGLIQNASVPRSTGSIGGVVHGGQQPISGANIRIMAVGTSGDGSPATSLMNQTVTSNVNGNFTLDNTFDCPSSPTQVYLLATGGNPGLGSGGSNPQISAIVGLGLCSSITSSTFISVNEVTSVASVAALAPFMTSATAIGSGSGDAAALAAAMTTITEYVNIGTGATPGPALPSGSSASTQALYALANSVAACINTAGGVAGDGTACGRLFSDVEAPYGVAPTDVVGAALDILNYPNTNVSAIYDLGTAQGPYKSTLTAAPANWTLPITAPGAGTVSFQHTVFSVTEGAAYVALQVNRNGSGAASVSYSTYNGTATAGLDYPLGGGTLTWAAGNTAAQYINLPIYNPGISGNGYRAFHVALNTPLGVTLSGNQFTQIDVTDSDTALTVSTSSLPKGTPGTAYSAALSAAGGVGSLTWALGAGSTLPPGLSLDSAGNITGTPQVLATTNSVFVVSDQATPVKQTVTVTLPIIITNGLAYQVSQLPTGTPAQAIKKALLTWGLGMVDQLNATNQSTAANNLTNDIQNDLNVTFTVPSSLPANLFPVIPNISANPSVTSEVSTLNTQLQTDARSTPTYPGSYTSALSASYDVLAAQQMTWALLYSGQSLYLNPALVPSLMTRMENGVASLSTFGPDFTTTSSVPLLYMMLTQGWGQLVFPSRQAVWLAQITSTQNAVVSGTVGTHLAAGPNDVINNWLNADVKWAEGVAYGAMILNQPQTAIVNGFLAEARFSLLPDGGTNYLNIMNESCEYHQIIPAELARYSQVTGDTGGYTIVSGMANYYPLSFEPGNVCEYITAPANKKYWDSDNGGMGHQVVTFLTGDPYNYYQMAGSGWAKGFDAAPFYPTNITGQSLPASWITYDRNSQGPHGVNNANNFSFQSSTRIPGMHSSSNYQEEGLPSYVGGMVVDSTANNAPWSLNGALERIGNTINYSPNAELLLTDGNFADLAVNPVPSDSVNVVQKQTSAQISTSTFGSVSSFHALQGYKGSVVTSWRQTETWILLPDRVIGLASIVNLAAEKAYQIEGAVHFVSGRATGGTQKTLTALTPTSFAYSVSSNPLSMVWQVFNHDYASISTEFSSTFAADGANKAANILLNDAHNSATTQYTWPAGTSHYFFSEFRPSTASAAISPTILSGLPTGLVGFSFTETNGTSYTIVHNPTASAILYVPPAGTLTMSGTQYRAPWIDPTGTQSVASATYTGSIPAYSHIVIAR